MADVSVIYRTESGEVLHSLSLLLTEGTRNIRANSALVPEGYELVSEEIIRISVDANGVANVSNIEFIYRLPGMSSALEVRYVDGDKVLFTTSLIVLLI